MFNIKSLSSKSLTNMNSGSGCHLLKGQNKSVSENKVFLPSDNRKYNTDSPGKTEDKIFISHDGNSDERDGLSDGFENALFSFADLKKDGNSAGEMKDKSTGGTFEHTTSEQNEKDIIMKQIKGNSDAYKVYQNMPPGEQKQFISLAEKCYKKCFSENGKEVSGEIEANLIKIMKDKKLSDKDVNDNTLLQNLTELQKQSFGQNIDGKIIFNETVDNIANPDHIKQGKKGTCAVATIEYLNSKNSPSEYVRIIAGLTGKNGKVQLHNGNIMKRDEGVIQDDGSDRTSVDRIYQASMMEYANGSKQNYSNAKDDNFSNGSSTGAGLSKEEFNNALNDVMGTKYKVHDYKNTPHDEQTADKAINDSLEDGKDVPVSMNFLGTGHRLVVEKIDGNYVYLRNPWGDRESGSNEDGPDRQVVGDGGEIKMTKEEFFKNLNNYSTPQVSGPDKTEGPHGNNSRNSAGKAPPAKSHLKNL